MATDLSNALSELVDSARRLNDLTDQATTAVNVVEEVLGKLSIGIGVWVAFDSRAASKNKKWRLGYQRTGNDRKYRIVAAVPGVEPVTWSELSRDLKLDAVTALPELVRTIATSVRERVERAESALAELSQILPKDSMKKGG
jgi:hypothetical protein